MIFIKPPIEPNFTELDKKLDEMLDFEVKPLPSCYDLKGKTREEYFNKIEFPVKWYMRNYHWADWVAIGVALLGLVIVFRSAIGTLLSWITN